MMFNNTIKSTTTITIISAMTSKREIASMIMVTSKITYASTITNDDGYDTIAITITIANVVLRFYTYEWRF